MKEIKIFFLLYCQLMARNRVGKAELCFCWPCFFAGEFSSIFLKVSEISNTEDIEKRKTSIDTKEA